MYYRKALNLRQRHEAKQCGCNVSSSGDPVDDRVRPAAIASMAPGQEGCGEGIRSRARSTFCESDAAIAYKVAVCYQELRDWEAAANILETIPGRLRSATAYNMLGRLYRHMCHVGKAIDAFKVLLQLSLRCVSSFIMDAMQFSLHHSVETWISPRTFHCETVDAGMPATHAAGYRCCDRTC